MLNKLILRAFLSISLALSFTGAANATLISQDILFNSEFDTVDEYSVIGNVTISLDTMNEWGEVSGTWESFSFYGFEVDAYIDGLDTFEAVVDVTNIAAGIESLDFEVSLFADLIFAGFIDTYNPADSISYSLFDQADGSLWEAGTLAFGEASVVPTPATLVLFLTAIAGIASRRKNI
jgi:hypothetical protein